MSVWRLLSYRKGRTNVTVTVGRKKGEKEVHQENPTDPAYSKSGSCCFRLCFVSFVTLVGVMKDGITCVLSSIVLDVDVDVVIAIVTEVTSFFGTGQVG